LDLIDDRVFWNPTVWVSPEKRSLLWNHPDGGLAAQAAIKRRGDRPYVVGQWCSLTSGAWSLPHEAADMLLGSYVALRGDWDALIRRGVFIYPLTWGEGPAGTVGGEDIFQIAEVINGSPHIYALWPHAASLFLSGAPARNDPQHRTTEAPARTAAKGRRRPVSGWNAQQGRLVIDTPYTQGIAGWVGGEAASLTDLDFATDNPFAVVVATSISDAPIATTKRLLVTAIARVEPTGFRWVDSWKREVADPGRPPFLREPVTARVAWRHNGPVKAYALDNTGARLEETRLERPSGGQTVMLPIDGKSPAFHWELIAE
jgi:hypothetical protein